jgi:hypothetical protein
MSRYMSPAYGAELTGCNFEAPIITSKAIAAVFTQKTADNGPRTVRSLESGLPLGLKISPKAMWLFQKSFKKSNLRTRKAAYNRSNGLGKREAVADLSNEREIARLGDFERRRFSVSVSKP